MCWPIGPPPRATATRISSACSGCARGSSQRACALAASAICAATGWKRPSMACRGRRSRSTTLARRYVTPARRGCPSSSIPFPPSRCSASIAPPLQDRRRGGALVTSHDQRLPDDAPLLGLKPLSKEEVWANSARFLQRAVPDHVPHLAGIGPDRYASWAFPLGYMRPLMVAVETDACNRASPSQRSQSGRLP
jgi:hypothetical protein